MKKAVLPTLLVILPLIFFVSGCVQSSGDSGFIPSTLTITSASPGEGSTITSATEINVVFSYSIGSDYSLDEEYFVCAVIRNNKGTAYRLAKKNITTQSGNSFIQFEPDVMQWFDDIIHPYQIEIALHKEKQNDTSKLLANQTILYN